MAYFAQDRFKDNSIATVATGGFNSAATTINLASGEGTNLPSKGPFTVTVYNATDYKSSSEDPSRERIRVPASYAGGDTITGVTRGVEGTSAANHNTAGKTYKIIAPVTANVIEEIQRGIIDVINPLHKDHGAVGDGTTDDTAAINSAIATVNAQPGSMLYLPRNKTFKVVSALNAITRDHVVIFGGGTIHGVSVSSGYLMTIGASGSAIENCRLQHIYLKLTTSPGVGALKCIRARQIDCEHLSILDDGANNQAEGIVIEGDCYLGVVRHSFIIGRFSKGIRLIDDGSGREPNGFFMLNNWLNRTSQVGKVGTGISQESAATGVMSSQNYLEGWDIGLDVQGQAAYHSHHDTFDANDKQAIFDQQRCLMDHPTFSGTYTEGIRFQSNCVQCVLRHLYRATTPGDPTKIIIIDASATNTRLEIEDARYDNNTTDNGTATILIGEKKFKLGGPIIMQGTGTPEGVVTASVGSLFMRTNGGAATSFYVKESGSGNTGWVAK